MLIRRQTLLVNSYGSISTPTLSIQCANEIKSESASVVALYNNTVLQSGMVWSITQGSQYATIDSIGEITILQNASNSTITVSCSFNGLVATKDIVLTYKSGSESQTETEVTVDPSTGETITTTTTTTTNEDGSSESTSTSYNEDGSPISTVNNKTDTNGNITTQDIEYDDNGNSIVVGYDVDTSNSPNGILPINGEEIDTEYYAFDATRAFELMIHFKYEPSKQTEAQATVLNAKRADPEPWYGFDIRRTGSNLQYGAQFSTGSNNRSTITKNSNNIYKIKVNYDPTVSNGETTFVMYDMINNKNIHTSTLKFPDLPELRYLEITIGCALTAQGTPQRRSVIDLYDFYVKKL